MGHRADRAAEGEGEQDIEGCVGDRERRDVDEGEAGDPGQGGSGGAEEDAGVAGLGDVARRDEHEACRLGAVGRRERYLIGRHSRAAAMEGCKPGGASGNSEVGRAGAQGGAR